MMQKLNINISTSDGSLMNINTEVAVDQIPLVMGIIKLIMEHSQKCDDEKEQKNNLERFDMKKERETFERLFNHN